MKMLSVRLDDAEFAALTRLAEQLGETRSQVVKRGIDALARSARDKPTPYELAERLGLIGSFAGSPALSTRTGARVRAKLRAEHAGRR
jgi:hypothetical protein